METVDLFDRMAFFLHDLLSFSVLLAYVVCFHGRRTRCARPFVPIFLPVVLLFFHFVLFFLTLLFCLLRALQARLPSPMPLQPNGRGLTTSSARAPCPCW